VGMVGLEGVVFEFPLGTAVRLIPTEEAEKKGAKPIIGYVATVSKLFVALSLTHPEEPNCSHTQEGYFYLKNYEKAEKI